MRFKVGDLAKVVVSARCPENIGKVCQILAVGPYQEGTVVTPAGRTFIMSRTLDYLVDLPGKTDNGYMHDVAFVSDFQLMPIEPPAEPKSLTRSKENQGV